MSTIRHIPPCHDHKFEKVDREFIVKNFAASLETFETEKMGDSYIAMVIRDKDQYGTPYFGVGVVPLDSLQAGDEIKLATNSEKKLVVVNRDK